MAAAAAAAGAAMAAAAQVALAGMHELLAALSDEDLQRVAATSTRNAIDARSREDAINAIIHTSETPEELLRRRKVKRDLLFRYLMDCGSPAPASSDKQALIARILALWGVADCTPRQWHSAVIASRSLLAVPAAAGSGSGASAAASLAGGGGGGSGGGAGGGAGAGGREQAEAGRDARAPVFDPQTLADHFVAQFYDKYVRGEWEPNDFYADVATTVRSPAGQDVFSGKDNASACLRSLRHDLQLYFNVNPDGIRPDLSSHGALKIEIHGTVHCDGTVVGPFQHMVLLIRDPHIDNDWRIKALSLQQTHPHRAPSDGHGGGGGDSGPARLPEPAAAAPPLALPAHAGGDEAYGQLVPADPHGYVGQAMVEYE